MALGLLVLDLVCLVLDLGDPLRFHHMLRVFKVRSPMSVGTWSLVAFSLPLGLLGAMTILGFGPGWDGVRRVLAAVGLVPALVAAMYKGVLFSTTAQPGWRDARWLGGYLATSAVLLGCAELLLLALLLGQPGGDRGAPHRDAGPVGGERNRPGAGRQGRAAPPGRGRRRRRGGHGGAAGAAVVVGAGAVRRPPTVLIVAGAVVVRRALVHLPHG